MCRLYTVWCESRLRNACDHDTGAVVLSREALDLNYGEARLDAITRLEAQPGCQLRAIRHRFETNTPLRLLLGFLDSDDERATVRVGKGNDFLQYSVARVISNPE